MWSVILYTLAVIVGLMLFFFYEPHEEKEADPKEIEARQLRRCKSSNGDFRLSSVFATLGISFDSEKDDFEAFTDHFNSFKEVSEACKKAGLESSNLVIGIDFTASNEWQGRKSFNQNSLHKLSGSKVYNPYQKVIWILGQTLAPFDVDNLIPAYGFGDTDTTDIDVFSFKDGDLPCVGFQDVLDRYNEVVCRVTLSGPTSFAPIIHKTIDIVRMTKKYHILVIVADGQVNEEKPTIDAIVEASNHPISIIVVGVGDGPWDVMDEFDHRLPKRKFDNFRFVDYHKATQKAKNPDAAFALQALMEIPDQYKRMMSLGYIEDRDADSASTGSSPRHTTPHGSPKHLCSGGMHEGGLTHRRPSGTRTKHNPLSFSTRV